ncbi:hypothetical protein CRENBAI_007413 [Crenichthys baileyi]|uniref:Uncharacterized protein n=1 Tax=Crenichthys baileyi TaxID=28760 RepID=A0AAV9QTU9_9TELE
MVEQAEIGVPEPKHLHMLPAGCARCGKEIISVKPATSWTYLDIYHLPYRSSFTLYKVLNTCLPTYAPLIWDISSLLGSTPLREIHLHHKDGKLSWIPHLSLQGPPYPLYQ